MNVLDLIALTGIPMSHPMLNTFYGDAGTCVMLDREAWGRAVRVGAFHANPMHADPRW